MSDRPSFVRATFPSTWSAAAGLCLIACTMSCSDSNAPQSPAPQGGNSPASGGDAAAGAGGTSGAAAGALGGGSANGGNATSGGVAGTAAAAGGATAGGGTGGVAGGGSGSGGAAPGAPCSPPADIKMPAAKLSETGCMDSAKPTAFASFAIPYDVNSPLWSDSADKLRAMVIPAGKKIHVRNCATEPEKCSGPADNGDWDFPTGTVLLKNFAFDGKLVETRLFIQYADAKWVGYGYQWNEAQTEAVVVPDMGAMVPFNTGGRTVNWAYPSRDDCMTCHDSAAGGALGPETAQMNRVGNGKNQIDRIAELGLFDAPVPMPYVDALVAPYDGPGGGPPATATLEERARSYLHANCAYCHRPGGEFEAEDLRYGMALKDTNICNAIPIKGTAGVDDPLILAPGEPTRSVLLARMKSLEGRVRMPAIGTHEVDSGGVTLIEEWIKSIAACPQ